MKVIEACGCGVHRPPTLYQVIMLQTVTCWLGDPGPFSRIGCFRFDKPITSVNMDFVIYNKDVSKCTKKNQNEKGQTIPHKPSPVSL